MAVARDDVGRGSPVASARALASRAAELAPRAEAERRLPPELVDALAQAGLFRLLVPRSAGGGEASPEELVECVEALARGDGSAGWCLAIAATSGVLAAYLPEEHAAEVFGPHARCWGGAFAPTGRAVAADGTLQVSGRWAFISGIDHCDWLMGGCVLEEGGGERRLRSGRQDVSLVLFPAEAVERIDTWDVAGLCGTGSHDMVVEGLEVPASRSASLFADHPRESGPLYAFPVFGLLALAIGAVCLGIARGATDDLTGLADSKVPTMSSRSLAARPDTQARVARAEARLRAACALVHEAVGEAWEEARGEGRVAVERRAALRLAASHATSEAAAVTDEMYALGGGSSIYRSSPLQRRFRDVHTATQHMLVGPSVWELAGGVLLGAPGEPEGL